MTKNNFTTVLITISIFFQCPGVVFAQIGSGTQNAGKCNTVVPII